MIHLRSETLPFSQSITGLTVISPSSSFPAITLAPDVIPEVPHQLRKMMEIVPAYTNADGFRGRFYTVISTSTNLMGDQRPDIIHRQGYNFGGNAYGIAPWGITDTNEPAWQQVAESRWQNAVGESHLEWYLVLETPYTEWGTNFPKRVFGINFGWDTTNKTYRGSDANLHVGSFSLSNPLNKLFQSLVVAFSHSNRYVVSVTAKGLFVTETNDLNNGGVTIKGGTLVVQSPDGAPANSLKVDIDYKNVDGRGRNARIYSGGFQKSLEIGAPGERAFTNTVVFSNLTVLGVISGDGSAISGVQADSISSVYPSGSDAPGTIRHDSDFIYICVASNVWKRIALESFIP